MAGGASFVNGALQTGQFGANGATPAAAYGSGGAFNCLCDGYNCHLGFTTLAGAANLVILVNNIRAALVQCGIMS